MARHRPSGLIGAFWRSLSPAGKTASRFFYNFILIFSLLRVIIKKRF